MYFQYIHQKQKFSLEVSLPDIETQNLEMCW